MTAMISLVERKKFDARQVYTVASNIWWVGFKDNENTCSHNPYLLVDGHESLLINPGSRADKHYQLVKEKIESITKTSEIEHIVVMHNDPERCASVSLFEKLADRNVRIYAPVDIAESIKFFGCNHPIIGLEGGDSIILKSGRTLTFYETPQLNFAGSGMLFDDTTGTLFSGNLFKCPSDDWELYAKAEGWNDIRLYHPDKIVSKKAFHQTLNKIDHLSPQRICPHRGQIIEENIDKFLTAAREISFEN
ncbi:MAG: hypothetical protein R3F48_17995 [Candidatus Zixiibacteriota bacterium]